MTRRIEVGMRSSSKELCISSKCSSNAVARAWGCQALDLIRRDTSETAACPPCLLRSACSPCLSSGSLAVACIYVPTPGCIRPLLASKTPIVQACFRHAERLSSTPAFICHPRPPSKHRFVCCTYQTGIHGIWLTPTMQGAVNMRINATNICALAIHL